MKRRAMRGAGRVARTQQLQEELEKLLVSRYPR